MDAEDFSDVLLIVPQPLNATAPLSPWIQDKVKMKPLNKIPGTEYTLYSGTWQGKVPTNTHPFDVVATGRKGTVSSLFNTWDNVPQIFN